MFPTRKPLLIAAGILTLAFLFLGYCVVIGPEGTIATLGLLGMLGMALGLKTERYKSDERLSYTAGSAVTAGTPVQVAGGMVGIPSADIAASGTDEVDICGRFRARKASGAWAVGDTVGWDADGDPQGGTAGSGAWTNLAADWDFVGGSVVEAALTGDEYGVILLNEYLEGTPQASAAGLGESIADPGDAGAIPVTVTGHVNLVTAGAETRTIAAPTQVGQQLLLSFQTDEGNCVVTVATTINMTGNDTITFADAGDAVLLIAKKMGDNVRWSVLMNDGAALSTA